MVFARLRIATVSIATLVTILATFHAPAQEFPDGVRDTPDPDFATRSQPQTASRNPPKRHGEDTLLRLRYWNKVAVDASGLDHTPVAPGEVRNVGEQIGPGRSSRAMAIVHIAMCDAINAIASDYRS